MAIAPADAQAVARRGVATAGAAIPHAERIQQLFGRHEILSAKAQVGGPAADASDAIGARAYVQGDRVGFGSTPDLRTAAHEAAHVVQQRAGLAPAGGLDHPGDHLEQHADAVADAVVGGRSAEGLLDQLGGGASTVAVQRDAKKANAVLKVVVYQKGKAIQHWQSKARWEGNLPQQYKATRSGGHWVWDDSSLQVLKVETDRQGGGGQRVVEWANPQADEIVVYVTSIDDVTIDKNAGVTDNAPGHGKDKTAGGSNPDGRGHGPGSSTKPAGPAVKPGDDKKQGGHHDGGGDHDSHAPGAGSTQAPAGTGHPPGTGQTPGGKGGGPGGGQGDKGGDHDGPQAADQKIVDELEKENDIEPGDEDAGDNAPGGGGKKPGGKDDGDPGHHGDPDGRKGGTGPGGKDARADGEGEGSKSKGAERGSEGGSSDGQKGGTAGGMYGGEGKPGDDGVPSGIGLFGGLIAIPAALKGAVELALIISQGDITGAAGGLFKKGFGKIASIVAARKVLAREAKIVAAKGTKAALKEIATNKRTAAAWKAASAVEKKAVTRRIYWELQRKYFDAFSKAAKQAQRNAKAALKRSAKNAVAKGQLEAAAMADEVAAVKPVAGRLPSNHEFAGKAFPSKDLPLKYRTKGVKFTAEGYPDFMPHAQKLPNGKLSVEIEYTGSRSADFTAANKKAGLRRTPDGQTWHHVEDGKTMILVPTDLHDAVKHSGGVATYRHASGGLGYGD
jgi:hypothetical protein